MKPAALFLALFAARICASQAEPLAMSETGGVRYACGGVGAEERVALAQLRPQANAELLFVHGERGGYASGVRLEVYAGGSKTPAARIEAQGPICLLALPAGAYRLEAELGGAKRSARIRASAAPGKPVHAVFVFPAGPWDGVRASEEEKEQGRR